MTAQRGRTVLVVVPTFNRADLLVGAVESVLAQDYPEVRVVVVDDGSTDSTPAVATALGKAYPGRVLYRRKPNGGCSSARNVGLALLTDDVGFVCFLDSDDRFLPGKLSREVAVLDSRPDLDFTYSDSVVWDEDADHEFVQPVAAARRPEAFAAEHFLTSEATPAAVLYRARVVETLRFREDMRYHEDSEFLQRVALAHRGAYVPEPGCWVRRHAGGKSRNVARIQAAVVETMRSVERDHPAFYESVRRDADRKVYRARRSLFIALAREDRWDEARAHAVNPWLRLVLALRLGGFYRARRVVGDAVRRLSSRGVAR